MSANRQALVDSAAAQQKTNGTRPTAAEVPETVEAPNPAEGAVLDTYRRLVGRQREQSRALVAFRRAELDTLEAAQAHEDACRDLLDARGLLVSAFAVEAEGGRVEVKERTPRRETT